MRRGNMNNLNLDEIIKLCKNYYRIRTPKRRIKVHTEASPISEFIEEVFNFKTNILIDLNQLKGSKNKESIFINIGLTSCILPKA